MSTKAFQTFKKKLFLLCLISGSFILCNPLKLDNPGAIGDNAFYQIQILRCALSQDSIFCPTPVISNVYPRANSYVGGTTVSYTLSKNCASGSITWTRTGGTADPSSPQLKLLSGSELDAGEHNSIILKNNPALVNGTIYTIDFDCVDFTKISAEKVKSTNVTYGSTTARRVYGQFGSFTTSTVNAPGGTPSADSLNAPYVPAVDSTGTYITDTPNNRVLFYSTGSTTATRVYGQLGSFSSNGTNTGGLSANSLNSPAGVSVTAAGVYISDNGNNRVLFYSGTSTTASRVYGQLGSFTSNTANNGGITANSLSNTFGSVAADSGGAYINDYTNNRVLYFSGTSTTASRVYGQLGSFTTGTANNGGITADSLFGPYGIAVDSNGLYLAEAGNNRALFYPGTSTTATRVYGQSGSFTSGLSNNGGISANSLSNPTGIASDPSGVYIVDYNNHRMLYFTGSSTAASRVYGQLGNFSTATVNNGGISANSLNLPLGTSVDLNGIYTGDPGNNRTLVY
ncbi:MAG: NHL repeat-containing protein [Leptospira sp.]|nr:NHL repeat-containing protein [Leptospira sp.]